MSLSPTSAIRTIVYPYPDNLDESKDLAVQEASLNKRPASEDGNCVANDAADDIVTAQFQITHFLGNPEESKLTLQTVWSTVPPGTFDNQLIIFRLTQLNISYNCLGSLPNEISQLKDLKYLDISHNCLGSLPNEISQFKNLKCLNISHNYLGSLPNEISQLENLEQLDVSHNRLASLLQGMDQLKALTRLNLKHNPNLGLEDTHELRQAIIDLLMLDPSCRIYIGGTSLPDDVLNYLEEVSNNRTYPHPDIIFEIEPSEPHLLGKLQKNKDYF